MKKIIKSRLFLIIVCGIIFTSIGVYAASYLADDVSYSPENKEWNVDNVESALDSLYVRTLNYSINNVELLLDKTNTASASSTTVSGTLDVADYDYVLVQVNSWTSYHGTAGSHSLTINNASLVKTLISNTNLVSSVQTYTTLAIYKCDSDSINYSTTGNSGSYSTKGYVPYVRLMVYGIK